MEFLSPGHYKTERTPDVQTIRGTSISTGAIISTFEWGPLGKARLVTSLTELKRIFGGPISSSYGYWAAEGAFLNNPGMRLYIVRTCHYGDVLDATTATALAATVTLKDRATTPVNTLKIDALYPGKRGEKITVAVANGTKDPTNTFKLSVLFDGAVAETWDNLSMDPASANYVEARINGRSEYIRASVLANETVAPGNMPAVDADGTALTGGNDGLTEIAESDFVGSAAGGTGLYALDPIEDSLMITIPGITGTTAHNGLLTYVDNRTDCYALLDPPIAQAYADMVEYVQTTAMLNSQNGDIHWPNGKIHNWTNNTVMVCPPSGHLMGVYARTDRLIGPWQTPAGTDIGQVQGMIGVEDQNVNRKVVRDVLYQARINPIRAIKGKGICVWGSLLLDDEGLCQHKNERRTFMYVQKSVETETQWVEFKNNSEELWRRITRTVSAFLLRIWKAGGLRGTTPEEAFIVKCDADNNDPNTPVVHALVGLAVHKPSDFVWFEYTKLLAGETAAAETIQAGE